MSKTINELMKNIVVKVFNLNNQTIENYAPFSYKGWLKEIKSIKKKCETKEKFYEELRREVMWRYWSKAEWELIVTKTADGRAILSPWCGCRNTYESAIDVTDDTSFDWVGFAEEHISKQVFKNCAKIDVYDQLIYNGRLKKFAEELWNTRLPYERKVK